MKIPKEIKEVYEALTGAGYEAYLVGGCVRDLLLGRAPKDWDITTNAKPEEIQKIFPADSFYENDFGTVGVKTGSDDPTLAVVEITPYRIEEKYTDKRHPDAVKFTDKLEDDLKRRDFTINALALKLKTKDQELIDHFGGEKDLKNKIIRAVGNPEERFGEDALRIMRALRFEAELGFSIEDKTLEALREKRGLLEFISKERIRDELIKTIESDNASRGLEAMRELGILKFVMPELEEGWNVTQNKHHIYTVWEHNLRSLDRAVKEKWPLDIRMSALLHDVGKPRTKHGDGKDSTFYNHEIVGAKMTAAILSRLRFPKKFIDKVTKLVRYHLFYYNVGEVTESSVRRLVARVGAEDMNDLIKVRICDRVGSGVPKAEPYKLRHFQFMVDKVQRDPISVKMLKIKGDDIMRICAFEPGPKIGAILDVLLEEVLDDPKLNSKDYLEGRIKKLCAVSEKELGKLRESAKHKKIGLEEEEVGKIKQRYYVK
ncbi:MAG: HD domain-containing protein [Candidatus Niyogibacteria bacterium]|nr:MAG: HD domain-containing protein [Candidatus Niyogibacteria bacterium]